MVKRRRESDRFVSQICAQRQVPFEALDSELRRGGGRFCSPKCYHDSRSIPLVDRFWAIVNKTETCWLWTGGQNGMGYGTINRGRPKKTLLAHRVSWELHRGPIPPDTEVCHNCPGGDNSLCVNPDHLFLGTHADNMADMATKGLATNAYGENHLNAKLTWDKVREMRARYSAGGISMAKLAAEFQIGGATAREAIRQVTWKEPLQVCES